MTTPIFDFVQKYKNEDFVRAHMPGHKGKGALGVEGLDITEVEGADSLYDAEGIIFESERNASEIFGCDTFYSTEGSSLCIRAMVYLCTLFAKAKGKEPCIAAFRNVHKSFVSAAALCNVDIEWIYPEGENSYLTFDIDIKTLDKKLGDLSKKVCALYVTSPDYLGNILDIEKIAKVCKKYGLLLVVDNAHGAYLKFLEKSNHPIDLGAHMCCDSAHKTLPVLTGGAYLHISKDADKFFVENAKGALSLFGSTSPSYLILSSLDKANEYMTKDYKQKVCDFEKKVCGLKKDIQNFGFELFGNEPMKITVKPKSFGYTGKEIYKILHEKKIVCEFCDNDFVVLMLNEKMTDEELEKIKKSFSEIERKSEKTEKAPKITKCERVMSTREANLSVPVKISANQSRGCILARESVGCPPAVPIVVSGERIDKNALDAFLYYGIEDVWVVSKD